MGVVADFDIVSIVLEYFADCLYSVSENDPGLI